MAYTQQGLMRCFTCGTTIDDHVFPGATLRCARCGTLAVIEPSAQSPSGSPYRELASGEAPTPPLNSRRHLSALWPRCTRALEDADCSDLVCGWCHGAFVGHADLAARIMAARPAQPPLHRPRHALSRPPEPLVRYGRCPKCGDIMTRLNFGRQSGIVLDACREHGTWFDRGELESVFDFVRAGGIEEEPNADPPPQQGNDPSVMRGIEAQIDVDAMKEARLIKGAAQIANDLLSLVLGLSNRFVGE
jgi:Zn-finger nucleic acid-binding protein